KSASCLRRKRFSAARARRQWAVKTARRIRSITTGTIVRKQCATVLKSDEPGINAQHGTLQNVAGPTTAAWQEFLRTTAWEALSGGSGSDQRPAEIHNCGAARQGVGEAQSS